jgi:hypothetical protein
MPLFSRGSYPQALQESYQYSAKAGLFTPLGTTDQKQKISMFLCIVQHPSRKFALALPAQSLWPLNT